MACLIVALSGTAQAPQGLVVAGCNVEAVVLAILIFLGNVEKLRPVRSLHYRNPGDKDVQYFLQH